MRTPLFVLVVIAFLVTGALTITQAWPPGGPISPAIRACGFVCGALAALLVVWIVRVMWCRKGKTPSVRARHRSSAPGFTLTEMLAVLGIILIIGTVTVSAFMSLGQQQGPERGAAVLQSAIVGARSLAVETHHKTRLAISSVWTQDGSSVLTMQEFARNPQTGQQEWISAQRSPVELPVGVYALNVDFPAVPSDALDMNDAICSALTDSVMSTGGSGGPNFKMDKRQCFVQFTPEGTLDWGSFSDPQAVDSQLVLVRLGGDRIAAYSSYVLNTNTGTRLVFE